MMFKAVRGLVAVPSTQLTPADQRTRTNHQFKYRNILTNSTPYKFSSFLVPSRHGTSYQLRMVNAPTRLVQKSPTLSFRAHQSIGVISQWEFADYIPEPEPNRAADIGGVCRIIRVDPQQSVRYWSYSWAILSYISMQCTHSEILILQIRPSVVGPSNVAIVSKRMDISPHFLTIW